MVPVISHFSDFATGTVQRYWDERITPGKREKVESGLIVPVVALAIDVNWLAGVMHKTVREARYDYQRYHGVTDNDADQTTGVIADYIDDIDVILAQQVLWRGGGGSSFTTDWFYLLSLLSQAFQMQSPISGSSLPNL